MKTLQLTERIAFQFKSGNYRWMKIEVLAGDKRRKVIDTKYRQVGHNRYWEKTRQDMIRAWKGVTR